MCVIQCVLSYDACDLYIIISQPCTHKDLWAKDTVFDLINAPALITTPHPDFLLFFTYYRPLDDLLALVVENRFM